MNTSDETLLCEALEIKARLLEEHKRSIPFSVYLKAKKSMNGMTLRRDNFVKQHNSGYYEQNNRSGMS